MLSRWLYKCVRDPDVAIDLGTANTRLYVLDQGVVAEEPTTNGVARSGDMWFQSEVAPMRGGVVHDIDATATLLGRLMKPVHKFGRLKSRVLVCAPSDANEKERSALLEAVRRSGIVEVQLVPEPLASAVGSGLDITSPYAQMLVDIGDGVTDVAVIRSRKLVITKAVRRGGSDLRSALQSLVNGRKKLFLPAREADRLIREHGALGQPDHPSVLSALVYDRSTGAVNMELRREEVFEAVAPVLSEIVVTVCRAIEALPLGLAVEVAESGICLSGGGAYLRDMDRLISRQTSIEVKVTANPMRATIRGAAEILAAARQAELWETSWDSSRGFGT
jgi:rod shape-determining protein MreB and related proteins